MKYYLYLWLAMPLIAVANGILREILLAPHMSNMHAHQVSTLTGIIFFALFFYFTMRGHPLQSEKDALLTGVLWFMLTVAFEFILGLATGHSGSELIAAYNIFEGNLWPLLPLWIGIAPWFFHRLVFRRISA